MSELITRNDIPDIELQPVEPRIDFTIRPATLDDYAWIDAMHQQESDKLGFLMRAAIVTRIEQGNVLVAEATSGSRGSGLGSGGEETSEHVHGSGRDPKPETRNPAQAATPLGYCIHVDRYMKQDHVGQFIQLNVPPEFRRSLVGAALVKATFEKAAYGCKLYGLWCRQDLAANRFWEALGFVPLAFRASGVTNQASAKKKADPRRQIHIYWQRRVREGDTGSGGTAYWFPYETQGGMMAESRLVLPIPLGTHWSDAKPVVLPGAERRAEEARLLEASADAKHEQDKAALAAKRKAARDAAKEAKRIAESPKTVHGVELTSGGAAGVPMGFDLPPEAKAQRDAEEKAAAAAAEKARIKEEKREAKRAAKQARRKTDPELLAFSRELRDRWQEAVTAQPGLLLGPAPGSGSQNPAKYDVSRLIAGGPTHAEIARRGERLEALEIVSEVVGEVRRLDAA